MLQNGSWFWKISLKTPREQTEFIPWKSGNNTLQVDSQQVYIFEDQKVYLERYLYVGKKRMWQKWGQGESPADYWFVVRGCAVFFFKCAGSFVVVFCFVFLKVCSESYWLVCSESYWKGKDSLRFWLEDAAGVIMRKKKLKMWLLYLHIWERTKIITRQGFIRMVIKG